MTLVDAGEGEEQYSENYMFWTAESLREGVCAVLESLFQLAMSRIPCIRASRQAVPLWLQQRLQGRCTLACRHSNRTPFRIGATENGR